MGPRPRVLVLGGTIEARAIAQHLPVISSLAGRVANPVLPAGEVRIGGFGGADGLAQWLQDNNIVAVVDATHPFARRITANAVAACAQTGTPLLRVQRPSWTLDESWHVTPDVDAAADLLPTLGSRAFITTGRQGIGAFSALGIWCLIRCVDAPEVPLPQHHHLLLARGPYAVEDELALMRAHRIDVLVTKDSGGPLTEGKLDAARQLGIPVVVVARPAAPEVETVSTAEESLTWLAGHVPG